MFLRNSLGLDVEKLVEGHSEYLSIDEHQDLRLVLQQTAAEEIVSEEEV